MTLAVQAAQKFGQRPTVMLGVPIGDSWNVIDRKLAQAWTVLDNSTCSGCGQSLLRSTDRDAIGHMEVHDAICEGCLALDRRRNEEKKPPAGQKTWVVDTGNI